ncbi:E3 ubiquitin-protein ligase SINA-like 10 [Asparagus officinalis]|uniref:E3 ubiquitin-protein ligase SINA-like 10 n=1 Tax=Asparagus officinalis TaxID=4686 RepID=UPI00098E74F5|nr:E3 ubiquitin-protein ligase SINA-like 10 [Asparagus officinalis]
METRGTNKRKNVLTINDESQKKSQKSAEIQNTQVKLEGVDREEEERDESRGVGSRNLSSLVMIKTDVLDCFICFEPLRPPLRQCQNGHVACSACCVKLPENKCPSCSHPINFSNVAALEKIIASTISSCCYAKHGCSRTLPYHEILSHQETCIHAPCFCPMPKCTFSDSPIQVSTHFRAKHGSFIINLQYGKQLTISLKQDEPFVVLHKRNDPLFLLVNDKNVEGNSLSLACIRSSSTECDFTYELMVSGGSCSYQFKASPANFRKWEEGYPRSSVLVVPQNFCSSSGDIVLNICIKKGRMHINV